MTEDKDRQGGGTFVERVLDRMMYESEIGPGHFRYEIPDQIFTGQQEVEVDGKSVGIWDGSKLGLLGEMPAHHLLMQRAIARFVRDHGPISWSQIITTELEGLKGNEVQYPKSIDIATGTK